MQIGKSDRSSQKRGLSRHFGWSQGGRGAKLDESMKDATAKTASSLDNCMCMVRRFGSPTNGNPRH